MHINWIQPNLSHSIIASISLRKHHTSSQENTTGLINRKTGFLMHPHLKCQNTCWPCSILCELLWFWCEHSFRRVEWTAWRQDPEADASFQWAELQGIPVQVHADSAPPHVYGFQSLLAMLAANSVGRSVYHFGLHWIIVRTIDDWLPLKLCTDICSPHKMSSNDSL